ncbi:hypothetical protein HDR59_03355 [bacterium]|nr:hypothetical protein [bacterium]
MPLNDEKIEQTKEQSPKNTAFLLSHSKEETEFFNAFKSSNLHHSWLITGPKGIGKATLAYRIARYIFSLSNPDHLKNLNIKIDTSTPILENNFSYEEEEEGDDTEDMGFFESDSVAVSQTSPTINKVSLDKYDTSPLKLSPTHPIFERLNAGGLTDLIIIEREYSETTKKLKTEISVEQIRNLKEFFSKTSSEGGYKVAIIDSVDEMNANSKNALLKILEEAPKKSLLLLICHNINGILPTIKSRCRILKLSPIDNENMKLLLRENLPNITEAEITKLINISGGSIGNAINIYNNNGLDLQNKIFTIIPEIFNKKSTGILEIANLVSNEEVFKIFQHIILNFISNAIKYKSKIKLENIDEVERTSLETITNHYQNIKALFTIREGLLNNFKLYPLLNLDITALIISTFERLKNVY